MSALASRRGARGAQALQLGGLVAAIVLAALVNVLAARHFTRWDWTQDRRWSPSPATVETLHSLEQTIDVWVIAGAGEPVEKTLQPLLAAYRAESSRIEVHWVDPDRDAAALLDLQRRFGLEAGRADDGRIATDAVVIVASGDNHYFLTPQDLYEQSDETHVRPREERALTRAIRSVLGGDRATLCFTVGHGELSLDPDRSSDDHLQLAGAGLRDLLDKSNYDLKSVETSAPDAHEPFRGCSVVVIAGQLAPFSADEADRLRTWLLEGGSLLATVGPIESSADSSTDTGMVGAGLDRALAPFGIALDDDLVHDPDPAVSIPDMHGEGFFVAAHPHPVTASLVAGADAHPPRTALYFTRSLRHVSPDGAAPASDLLVTSDAAYAKRSLVGASGWQDAPPRDATDPAGPFVVAMASERQRVGPSAPHGPRVVVVGTRFILAEDNWRQPRPLHGAAFFVDSALSWLSARPAMVDVPDKAEIAAGMRVSPEGRTEVERYVLLLMPLAALLMGASVWAWRRAAENRPYTPRAGAGTDGKAGGQGSTA
jgi:hypothetical protein